LVILLILIMFGRGSPKCEVCKKELKKNALQAEVHVYGKVGKFKKYFCSEKHLEIYIAHTENLMKTRRACTSCGFR